MIEDMFEGEEIKENIDETHQDLEIKVEDVKPNAIEARITSRSYEDGKTWINIPQMTNITISN